MPASDLAAMTATQMAAGIASGAVSAEEVMRACLDRIEATEPVVKAFAHLDLDYALKQARDADDWRRSGRPIGPLHGVPVAIKDIIDTADYPAEYGSRILAGRRPVADATVVARLRSAGAVIIGKTVTTEFAYFSPGKTRNPHDPSRTPGGSSSGSAASVAAGMVPVAVGTQTNGSIIRPASFCGVFGMKPTHGLVSRARALVLSRHLDHFGSFARSIEDLALMLDAMAGHDPDDPDTRPAAARNFRAIASENFGLEPSLAFVRTPVWEKADQEARDALEGLVNELGDVCFAHDLPDGFAVAWDHHRAVMFADMAHNLEPLIGKGEISRQLGELIAEGRTVTATRYLRAVADAAIMRDSLVELFEQRATAIITLSSPGVAPVGEATGNPVFNSLWSLLGLPAISLPLLAGESGMPIGVQLVGAPGDDARLLRTANWLVSRLAG